MSLYMAFQPSIHGLYLACVLMPEVYLAFTVPGIVTLGMINNVFYIPAMYMRCMLANCHVPCTWPCKQLTFLLMWSWPKSAESNTATHISFGPFALSNPISARMIHDNAVQYFAVESCHYFVIGERKGAGTLISAWATCEEILLIQFQPDTKTKPTRNIGVPQGPPAFTCTQSSITETENLTSCAHKPFDRYGKCQLSHPIRP